MPLKDDESNEHLYDYNQFPKCPYCDHEIKDDLWEYNFTEDEKEISCPKCDRDFFVYADISIKYSTLPK